MTLIDLASLGSFVSALAVVASLIYLSLQVQQNSKHTKALLWQGAVGRGTTLFLAQADANLAAAWIIGNGETPTPEAVNQRQFMLQCHANRTTLEDFFAQHEDGLISDNRFNRIRSNWKTNLSGNPGLRSFLSDYASSSTLSDDKFIAFLNTIVAKSQAPSAATN